MDSSCNNGVFVEIYPLDRVNPDKIKYRVQLFQIKVCNNVLHYSCYRKGRSFKEKANILFAGIVCKVFKRDKIYSAISRIASKYNDCSFEYVDELVAHYNCKYLKKDMDETIDVPYEYLNLSIPVGYDACLRTTYGNYMEMPPVEKREEHHNKVVYYDPFHPYYDEEVKVKARQYFNE